MFRDEKIFKYSIAVFLGFLLGALAWCPLTYHIMKARFYDDLRTDQVAIQEQLNMILDSQPELYLQTKHLIRLMNGFESDMNEREKMVLTRDMPSRTIEIKPNEED